MTSAFSDQRILDLSSSLSGAFAARFYGDFGGEVILAETISGHPLRASEVLHAYANWNKKSVVIENDSQLAQLISSSDVVITTEVDSASHLFKMVQDNSHVSTTHLSITPHGLTGNLAGVKGNNLTASARTGFSHINVYENEPPLQLPNNLTGYISGVAGFIASSAVLLNRKVTGLGDLIDLSEVEALAMASAPWAIQAIYEDRGWCRGVLGGKARGIPGPLWQARDGLINFGPGDFRNWSESMRVLGLEEFAEIEELIPDIGRHGNPRLQEVAAAAAGTVINKDRNEMFHALCKLRSISGMVRDMSDIYECEHLEARDYFRTTTIGDKNVKLPGPSAHVSPTKWELKRPAPALNADAEEIDWNRRIKSEPSTTTVSPEGPLSGKKVLTFTHAWSGTFATELLGLLGAEVIQIEAPHRVDVWRRVSNRIPEAVKNETIPQHFLNTQGLYNSANLNKRAITLDMGTDKGRDIFWKLVPQFDIVMDNFTPQILKRWGITLETLAAKKPGIVFVSLSAYGANGPYWEYPGNGGTTEPMSGLSSIHGYLGDSGMNTGGMIPDPVSGYFTIAAVMAALHSSSDTGEAQRIEGSMLEALTAVVGDALGEYQISGNVPRPQGNTHPLIAPHNVYQSKDGAWVAASADTDDAWVGLSGLLGLENDSRFSTAKDRKNNEDELDKLFGDWARERSAEEIAKQVIDSGACAARVASIYDVYKDPDPDLFSSGFIVGVDHPETGTTFIPGRSWRLGSGASAPIRPAPCVGQHSEEVLKEYLNIDDDSYQALVENCVTGTIYDYERYKNS